MKYSNLNGIILAAGRGSRLKNLTKNKPKSFLKVKKKYIIDFVVENFKKSGIKNVSIVTGYKSHLFKSLKNVKIIVNKNLIEAKILFNNNQSLVDHIDKVWEDPYEWWHNKHTQSCVQKFINLYSKKSNKLFYKNLKKLIINS